jgi:DNA end-binding protein Ku
VARTGEHAIALEPRGTGMVATILRSANQVREPNDLFHSVQDVKISKDMIDLAKHIVQAKMAPFDPRKLGPSPKNRKGNTEEQSKSRTADNVIDLMDALQRSMRRERGTSQDAGGTRRKG